MNRVCRMMAGAGALIMLVCMCGCAGLSLTPVNVTFVNPDEQLKVIPVDATVQEASGIVVRLNAPQSRILTYREDNRLFARVKEARGIKLDFEMEQTDRYSPGSRPDSYVINSETVFQNEGGRFSTEYECSTRGAIVSFTEGVHTSRIGKFIITAWERTPLFPEQPVVPGDHWSYEERLCAVMRSLWVKDPAPEPYQMQATSTLTGFAIVNGVRCAVIETSAIQIKHQYLKVLFTSLDFTMYADITEITYLDYVRGVVIGRITTTRSRTDSATPALQDTGESQSIAFLSHNTNE